MNEFKKVFEKVNIKESTESKFLSYDELTDFPYDGEDYNGKHVKILRKGSWFGLSNKDPEPYGVDDDMTDECVDVEYDNGHRMTYVYDESGVLAYKKPEAEKKMTYQKVFSCMEDENFVNFLIEERCKRERDLESLRKYKNELTVCAAVVYEEYLNGSVIKEDYSNLSVFYSGYVGIEIKVNDKVSVLVYLSPGAVGLENQRQPEFFIQCNALNIKDRVYKCSDKGKRFGNVSMYEADEENAYDKMLTLLDSILKPFNE